MEQSGVRRPFRAPLAVVTGVVLPPWEQWRLGLSQASAPSSSAALTLQPGPRAWPRNNTQTQREGLTVSLSPEDHCPATLCSPRSVSSVAVLGNPGRNSGNVYTGYQLIERIQSRISTALGGRR